MHAASEIFTWTLTRNRTMKRYLTILLSLVTMGAMAQTQNCELEQKCCSADSTQFVPTAAIKTNLLYDATATINLGVEFAVAEQMTIDISGNYNAWYTDKSKNHKIRHAMIQPEFRYYFDENFKGHYLGAHLIAGEYNVNGGNWLFGSMISASTISDLEENRYEGVGYGAGISYGYVTRLADRLNLEFNLGLGYIYLDYDIYGPDKCDPLVGSDTDGYFGLTKLGVTLSYVIKQRKK